MFELVLFENLRHIDTRPSFLTTCCPDWTYCVGMAIILVALYGPLTVIPDALIPFVCTCMDTCIWPVVFGVYEVETGADFHLKRLLVTKWNTWVFEIL